MKKHSEKFITKKQLINKVSLLENKVRTYEGFLRLLSDDNEIQFERKIRRNGHSLNNILTITLKSKRNEELYSNYYEILEVDNER